MIIFYKLLHKPPLYLRPKICFQFFFQSKNRSFCRRGFLISRAAKASHIQRKEFVAQPFLSVVFFFFFSLSIDRVMSVLQQQLALLEADLENGSGAVGGWKDRKRQKQLRKRRVELVEEAVEDEEAERERRKRLNVQKLVKEKVPKQKKSAFEKLKPSRAVIDVETAEKQMELSTLFNFEDDEMVEKPEIESVDEDDNAAMSDLEMDSSSSDAEVKIFRFPDAED